MFRYVGLLLLFSSAALTGFYASAVLSDREQLVGRQVSFWQQFALQMDCLRSSPRQLVKLLAAQQEFVGDRFFRLLGDSFGDSGSFGAALSSAVKATPAVRGSPLADILLPLGDAIGIRDLDSQLAAISSVVLRLTQYHSAVAVDSRQKGGLYRRLGIITGLLLAVIFY